jgi:outer membrane protein assembly factor BamB
MITMKKTPLASSISSLSTRRAALLAIIGLAVAAPVVVAAAQGAGAEQNWPTWRGPAGDGVSTTADPPVTWSETANVKWKVKLPGRGTSAPIVWNDRVFLQSAVPAAKEGAAPPAAGGGLSQSPAGPVRFTLLCLDRTTGKTLWESVGREEVPHEGHHPDHDFASGSPVTDGEHVYAYFGSRGLYCYDFQGNQKWAKSLGQMRTKNGFGEGTSPALSGDTLVIKWDHEGEDFIVALDKRNGEERWRQPREEDTSWSTPLIVTHEGKAQVVTAATRKIRSYDLETGQLLWECAGLTPNSIPSPVAGDGIVYLTSGFRGNALLAIRLGRTGDLTGSDAIVWSHNRSTPYVPSPLLYQGRIYFFASNSGILSCYDAKTGKPLIDAARVPALQGVYASPVGAAGRVYLVGRNGATMVIKSADTLEVLATNQLAEKIDASPAVAGSELFLRGQESLYCIGK